MKYEFSNSPEFHVWDMNPYENMAAREVFSNTWMAKIVKPGDAVMDIGCGAGYSVKVLQELGYEILGVDLNQQLIEKAKSAGLNVVQEDALEAVRHRGSNFDVFCMSDFVEHVPLNIVVELVAEIAKNPGKRLFLCTPNLDSVMGFKFWFHMPTHVNAMHPFVIRQMLTKSGLRIIEEWTEYGNLPGSSWKLKIRRWILNKLFGPVQSQLFEGGGNVCFIAEVPSR